MAKIYDYETGDLITEGLQGSNRSTEAIHVAARIADERGQPVELHDDDGKWLVHPDPVGGARPGPDFLGELDADGDDE